MHKKAVYEQPLNERMRTLLRLEFLFKQLRHFLRGESVWDARCAVSVLLDLQGLFARGDQKAELLKELERHAANLQRLRSNDGVDAGRLNAVLAEVEALRADLQGPGGQIGAHIKDHEFLASIRQRNAIPGGTCDFDLPLYHHWLQMPEERRGEDLQRWLAGFETAREAVTLVLRLVRHSATPTTETARRGMLQRSLPSSLPCQMVRVAVPQELECYPEISGGKHRFTIRLLRQRHTDERPTQVHEDIPLELTLCVI